MVKIERKFAEPGRNNVPVPEPVGYAVQRLDGLAKVTGTARYTDDLTVPGVCFAAVVRSDYPHARLISIDVSAAENHPGVISVLTTGQLTLASPLFGQFMQDRPILADQRVRFVGEPIAGVVAETPFAAAEGARLVKVDYEPLPFVIDPVQALDEDAPLVHESESAMWYRDDDQPYDRFHPNLCSTKVHGWGDVDAQMETADIVLEDWFRFPRAFPGGMEQYSAMARYEGGTLTVWTAAGHPLAVQADLTRCFGLPSSRVEVIVPYVGGSFGGKSLAKIEPLVAALAMATGRAVKLALSMEDAMLTSRSSGATLWLKTGFTSNGRIVAREANLWVDAGAYADTTPGVNRAAAVRMNGAYRFPALRVRSYAVYTHTVPAGSFRGFGAQEGVWASEQQLDEAAVVLGLDPLDIRTDNLADKGERLWPTARPLDSDLKADLRALAAEMESEPEPEARQSKGRGLAMSVSDAEVPNSVSVSIVRMHADGSLTVLSGSTELGQGSQTVLAQIAAGEMGIPMDQISVVQGHTGMVPFERSTGASRTTTFAGRALQNACQDLRTQLQACAAEALGVLRGAVNLEAGGVSVDGDFHDWGSVVRLWFGGPVGELVGSGYVRKVDDFSESPPFWEVGCVGVDVTVDQETGAYRVDRCVTLADVGLAINPRLMVGQDAGAATMGMGLGMYEEIRYGEDGVPITASPYDYRMPRTSDMPHIHSILVERQDGVGPYGAKGAGEGTLNPVAPAIANAIWRACGVRVREAPITPERLWQALKDRPQSRRQQLGSAKEAS